MIGPGSDKKEAGLLGGLLSKTCILVYLCTYVFVYLCGCILVYLCTCVFA